MYGSMCEYCKVRQSTIWWEGGIEYTTGIYVCRDCSIAVRDIHGHMYGIHNYGFWNHVINVAATAFSSMLE